MKKGIYVYPESKNRRHCVRIAKRLTGTPTDPKKRFPWSDYLPVGVNVKTANKEDWRTARRSAKDAADAFAAERAAIIGTPRQVAFTLTPSQATDAITAIALLDSKASLTEAVRDYLKRHHPHIKATLRQVVDAYTAAKASNAKATKASIGPMLEKLVISIDGEEPADAEKAKAMKRMLISEITAWHIQSYIDSRPNLASNSVIIYLRELRTFFRWAVRKRYAGHNPAAEIDPPRKTHHEIQTLTPVETLRLLLTAKIEFDADCLAAITLAAFCGIRREELLRLDWSAVNLADRVITISAAAAKMTQRRVVKLRPNAVDWLMLCPTKTGPICPANYEGKFTAIAIKAGFVSEGKSTFPRNALRHNFASYLYAAEDEAMVIRELGHSSPKMIKEHYRALKLDREGRVYFSITPTITHEQLAAMLAPTLQPLAVSA